MANNNDDLTNLANALEEGVKAALNLSPIADKVVEIVQVATPQQIDSQGARGGSTYAELAPATIAERARQGFGKTPILKRRRTLERFVSSAAQATLSNGGKKLEVSFSKGDGKIAKIAAITNRGTKKMPARIILELTAQDRTQIKKAGAKSVKQSFLNTIRKR